MKNTTQTMSHGFSANNPDKTYDGKGDLTRKYTSVSPTFYSPDTLIQLGIEMAKIEPSLSNTPAGYTYLGQFITHDIISIGTRNNPSDGRPADLENIREKRTVILDLSSVYGKGWHDENVAIIKSSGRMRVGITCGEVGNPIANSLQDLPRGGKNGTQALIPDGRNDDHLLISQLHVQFLKIHNYLVGVIDKVYKENHVRLPPKSLFKKAQKILTQLYQYVIVPEYLRQILHPSSFESCNVVTEKNVFAPRHLPESKFKLPIEFSGAAFKLHSMLREQYTLNENVTETLQTLISMGGKSNLNGHPNLPESHIVDWRCFFNAEHWSGEGCNIGKAYDKFNFASKIWPGINIQIPNAAPEKRFLSVLHLLRSNELQLPCAQDLLKDDRLSRITKLSEEELLGKLCINNDQSCEAEYNGVNPINENSSASQLARKTPLWYYILAEAYSQGNKGNTLGMLGSKIVHDTFDSLLKVSREPKTVKFHDQIIKEIEKDLSTFTCRDNNYFYEENSEAATCCEENEAYKSINELNVKFIDLIYLANKDNYKEKISSSSVIPVPQYDSINEPHPDQTRSRDIFDDPGNEILKTWKVQADIYNRPKNGEKRRSYFPDKGVEIEISQVDPNLTKPNRKLTLKVVQEGSFKMGEYFYDGNEFVEQKHYPGLYISARDNFSIIGKRLVEIMYLQNIPTNAENNTTNFVMQHEIIWSDDDNEEGGEEKNFDIETLLKTKMMAARSWECKPA